MNHDPSRDQSRNLSRVLTHWDASALIVGIVIGSGIFATPPQIAATLDRFGPMLLVWLLGGLLALTGALTYAELAAMFPRTGGAFVFLRETYGRAPAFIYGWSALFITYPASVAAVSVVFAAYLCRLVPISAGAQPYIAAGLSLVMCGINIRGVVLGARVQRVFTAVKVAALGSLALLPFVFVSGRWENLTPVFASPSRGWSAAGFALALAAVMWTFEGWADGPTLGGEVRDLKRDLPKALVNGTILVTAIYLVINVAYVYVLGISGIAATDTVAVEMATRVFGQYGALFVTLLVLVSTVGSVNGMVIAGSRVFFAMARDGLFFKAVGQVHPRFGTPANSLLILGVVSATYCLLGTFAEIINYFVFIAMLWFVLVVASVFIQRMRRPDAVRPFRVPLYPITPLIFLLAAIGLAGQLYLGNMQHANVGLGILIISIPVYFLWRRLRTK